MASAVHLLVVLLVMIIFESEINCDDSPQSRDGSDKSELSSIPVLPSGKRQHNIMRFGKRPSSGHSLIHFGKRTDGSKSPQHSFLYFGKRANDQETISDILQRYLQKDRDNSYKRGHAIMRFGKRGENHNFIRFGKRDDADYDDTDEYYPVDYDEMDDQKRDGHSMLYFGKRAGHAILSFGKREMDDQMKRAAHSMIHFGKRDDDSAYEDKRAHAMIHFGKRDLEPEEQKRGPHSMIHFGKRNPMVDDVSPLFWYPEMSEKRQHNLLRFGKKTEGARKGSHAMIHFGKREDSDNKRAHAMIHFGKRSVDQNIEPDTNPSGNQSEENSQNDPNQRQSRIKRDTDSTSGPLVTLVKYDSDEEGFDGDDEDVPSAYTGPKDIFYTPDDVLSPFLEPEDLVPGYTDYRQPIKKDDSKNVFLRFG